MYERCFNIAMNGGCGITCPLFREGGCEEADAAADQVEEIIEYYGDEGAYYIFLEYDCFKEQTMKYSLLENVNSTVTMAISEDKTCLRIASKQATSGGAINVLRQAARARTVEPTIRFVTVAFPNLTQEERRTQERSLKEIVKGLDSPVKISVLKTDETTQLHMDTLAGVEC